MKLSALVWTAAAAVALISPAFGEGADLHFSVKNDTSNAIKELYVSHVGTDSWENDLLGGDAIQPGEEQPIVINDGRDGCKYDVKVVYDDGSSNEEREQDLCSFDGGTYEYHN